MPKPKNALKPNSRKARERMVLLRIGNIEPAQMKMWNADMTAQPALDRFVAAPHNLGVARSALDKVGVLKENVDEVFRKIKAAIRVLEKESKG